MTRKMNSTHSIQLHVVDDPYLATSLTAQAPSFVAGAAISVLRSLLSIALFRGDVKAHIVQQGCIFGPPVRPWLGFPYAVTRVLALAESFVATTALNGSVQSSSSV